MSKQGSWVSIVLEALKNLRADEKPVSTDELYNAVKKIASSRCDDADVYTYNDKGRLRSEPRWRRNVRDALVKLKRKRVVVSEGRGKWRLIKTSSS